MERADLEEQTVMDMFRILSAEFEDDKESATESDVPLNSEVSESLATPESSVNG